MLCYKDHLKDDPYKCFAFFGEVCLRQAKEASLITILSLYTFITLLFLVLVSFSVLCSNFAGNYKTNKKTPISLIGRQHSGVRHSSCAESVSTGMKKATTWDERGVAQKYEPVLSSCEGDFKYAARIKTLAETERLFDELTQEKQQAKIIFIFKL